MKLDRSCILCEANTESGAGHSCGAPIEIKANQLQVKIKYINKNRNHSIPTTENAPRYGLHNLLRGHAAGALDQLSYVHSTFLMIH
jgi:hypothetical protein